jgi:hypothetical protein
MHLIRGLSHTKYLIVRKFSKTTASEYLFVIFKRSLETFLFLTLIRTNSDSGVTVRVIVSNAVDRGMGPQSGQTKNC